jgi:hypothetical protein
LREASRAQAKVLLVGAAEHLHAGAADGAFRALAVRHGVFPGSEILQTTEWQQRATQDLAQGRTAAALVAYRAHGQLITARSRTEARSALIVRWAHHQRQNPTRSQLVFTANRVEAEDLNETLRTLQEQRGQLGAAEELVTERGRKVFAVNDRMRCLRPAPDLGLKNGSWGTVQAPDAGVLQLRLDAAPAAPILLDTRVYRYFDYG